MIPAQMAMSPKFNSFQKSVRVCSVSLFNITTNKTDRSTQNGHLFNPDCWGLLSISLGPKRPEMQPTLSLETNFVLLDDLSNYLKTESRHSVNTCKNPVKLYPKVTPKFIHRFPNRHVCRKCPVRSKHQVFFFRGRFSVELGSLDPGSLSRVFVDVKVISVSQFSSILYRPRPA